MIKIIKGTYGLVVGGTVEAMTPRSAPFSLSKTREAELVAAGVAEYVEEPEPEESPYSGMTMAELRKAAAALGVDASAAKKKTEVIALLEAAAAKTEAEQAGADASGE